MESHDNIPAQDPDHDIDATKTVVALTVCTLFVFVAMGALYALFNTVITEERYEKIDQAPTYEQRLELEQVEDEALGDGEGRVNLDEAMKRYVDQKGN